MVCGERAEASRGVAGRPGAAADEARWHYNGLYHQLLVTLPDRPRLVESLFMTLKGSTPSEPAEPAVV